MRKSFFAMLLSGFLPFVDCSTLEAGAYSYRYDVIATDSGKYDGKVGSMVVTLGLSEPARPEYVQEPSDDVKANLDEFSIQLDMLGQTFTQVDDARFPEGGPNLMLRTFYIGSGYEWRASRLDYLIDDRTNGIDAPDVTQITFLSNFYFPSTNTFGRAGFNDPPFRGNVNVQISSAPSTVPEPSTAAMLAAGAIAVSTLRRRKQKTSAN
jgi:hypothetical protein